MRRTTTLLAALGLSMSISCDKSQPTTAPPQTPPPAETSPADATADATAQGDEAAEPSDEKTKEEQRRKQLEASLKRLEQKYAKEGERWDEELEKQTAKLSDTKWRNTKKALQKILASPHREPGNADRDKYRHPVETLTFFGLKPTMTVYEVGPGAGWYTEILAPLLAKRGKLVLAGVDTDSEDPGMRYYGRAQELMLGKSKGLYGQVEALEISSPSDQNLGEEESLDMVLVFRMFHNIVRSDTVEPFLESAYSALKPGGVLAVVQHRAPEGADPRESAQKGYVPQAWLIETIEAAGFKLQKKSEINANPKDTKDYEKGVWTLPPTYALGDTDKDKYTAIGESDRMTLKFVKPKNAKKTAKKPGKKDAKAADEDAEAADKKAANKDAKAAEKKTAKKDAKGESPG